MVVAKIRGDIEIMTSSLNDHYEPNRQKMHSQNLRKERTITFKLHLILELNY